MTFIWPVLLLSLIAVPLLAAAYLRAQRRRRGLAARYGSLGQIVGAGGRWGWRRHLPIACFLVGLAVLGVALARPQTVVSLPRVEGTVVLAFDVSASMAADDLKPTRMEAAKAAAREFVRRQPPTVQIGVVAFSESGLAVQPPSDDRAATLAAIDRLAPSRGTSLANGILASLNVIAAQTGQSQRYYTNLTPAAAPTPTPVPRGTFSPAAIILLTDGDNTAPPSPAAAARAAADRGVRVYTIGVGSPNGATLKIEGFAVQTRLDEATLRQIAALTSGAYYNAGDEQALRAIYGQLDSQLVVRPAKMEVTALFAAAGLAALLIGGACSLLWLGRVP